VLYRISSESQPFADAGRDPRSLMLTGVIEIIAAR
jgi:hypothetical protein